MTNSKPKDYNSILQAVYRDYNPDKVDLVLSLLTKYKGREEELLQSIYTKYGIGPEQRQAFEQSQAGNVTTASSQEEKKAVRRKRRNRSIAAIVIVAVGIAILLLFLNQPESIDSSTTPSESISGNEMEEAVVQERIAEWIIPERNNVKKLALIHSSESQVPKMSKLYCFSKLPDGRMGIKESFFFDGRWGSSLWYTLSESDNQLTAGENRRAGLLAPEKAGHFGAESVLFQMPQGEDDTARWQYAVPQNGPVSCRSYFTRLSIKGESRKVLAIEEKPSYQPQPGASYASSSNYRTYYQKGKGIYRQDWIDTKGVLMARFQVAEVTYSTKWAGQSFVDDMNSVSGEGAENSRIENETGTSVTDETGTKTLAVRSQQAFFYDTPDESTRRNGYLVAGEQVEALQIENEYCYVEFTNRRGQVSKGWIRLRDLEAR